MKFKYSVIGDNTAENRKHLKDIGYVGYIGNGEWIVTNGLHGRADDTNEYMKVLRHLAFIEHQKDVKECVFKGITRIEYTLAGQRQLKAYNLAIKSLKDVLNTPNEEYIRVLIEILEVYNNNKKRVMAKDVKLSLTDSLLLGFINALVEAGYSMTRIIDIASNSGNSASDSSKNKKRVKELLNYIENKDILEQNNAQQKEVNDVLKFLQVYKD